MATMGTLPSTGSPAPSEREAKPNRRFTEDRWSRTAWWWWLGSISALSLLMTLYRHFDQTKGGLGWPLRRTLVDETTAIFGAGLLFFAVRALVRWRPLTRSSWIHQLPCYAAGALMFSGLHTSMNWGLRRIFYDLVGLNTYHYGPGAFARELPIDLILFLMMVAVLFGARQAAIGRAQALESARLSRALSESRLDALTRSLEPHFLFNALNTISSTMYRDIEAADEMTQHLADLLRTALDRRQASEVPVRDELATLGPYLAIMRARFEERLSIVVDVDEATHKASIPTLLLQPLIENAVRHGGAERIGTGRIEVSVSRHHDRLLIVVEDDGPGAPVGLDPLVAGHGLRTSVERLRLLYGDDHHFEAGNRVGGGFRVAADLPYRVHSARRPEEGDAA